MLQFFIASFIASFILFLVFMCVQLNTEFARYGCLITTLASRAFFYKRQLKCCRDVF